MTDISRRQVLGLGAAATVATMVGMPSLASAESKADAAIKAFAGGASVSEGRVTLDMPEIAENGNTVPLTVSVDSPMTDGDYVEAVTILADGNPNPAVATFHFTPASGVAEASTRMRLAKTQDVIAVAKMSDGSHYMAKTTVKVTIGGCGG